MNNQERIHRLQRYDPGRFMLFSFDLLCGFGDSEALLLSELIQQYLMRLDPSKDDGWCHLPSGSIRLPWGKRKTQHVLATLVKSGVVSCRRVGMPSERWIRVYPTRIAKLIQLGLAQYQPAPAPPILCQPAQCQGVPKRRIRHNWGDGSVTTEATDPSQLSYQSTDRGRVIRVKAPKNRDPLNKGRKERRIPPSPLRGSGARATSGGKLGKRAQEYPECLAWATQLATTVNKVRKVQAKSKPATWWQDFRKLKETDGIPTKRISKLLDWYCHVLKSDGDLILSNPNFIPIAYSGPVFRRKFDQLEAAMFREKNSNEGRDGRPPRMRVRAVAEEDPNATLSDWGV